MWLESAFKTIDPAVWIPLLLAALVLAFMTRPRFPWVIYAQRNIGYFKIFLLTMALTLFVSIGMQLAMWGILPRSPLLLTALFLIIGIPFFLWMLWLLFVRVTPPRRTPLHLRLLFFTYRAYVYRVYNKNKKKKRKCRKEIWTSDVPPLVVDGKRYYMSIFDRRAQPGLGPTVWEPVAVDEEGRPVRDRELMDRLMRCARLGAGVLRGIIANEREKLFRTRKGHQKLKKLAPKFDELAAAVLPEALRDATLVAKVKRNLEIYLTFADLMYEDHWVMARWEASKRWGWRLEEVWEEDVQALESQLKAFRYAWPYKEDLYDGRKVALKLRLAYRRKQWRGRWWHQRKFYVLVEAAIAAWEAPNNLWGREVPEPTRFYGLLKWEEKAWRERLKWIERVEGWKDELGIPKDKAAREKYYRHVSWWSGWQPAMPEIAALEAKKKAWCEETGGKIE